MKSAYELALERLAKSDPDSQQKLTPKQKQQLADADTLYKSKLAEHEIHYRQQLASTPDPFKQDQLRQQFQQTRIRLEEDRDSAKQKIRSQK